MREERVGGDKEGKERSTLISLQLALPILHATNEAGVQSGASYLLSVTRFCYVFPCEWRGPARAVGSYSISQSAGGTSQNIIFKTLRQTGQPTMYDMFLCVCKFVGIGQIL